MENMKEKLLQAEQQLTKSKHDLALKAMEVERIKVELNRAWVKLICCRSGEMYQ